MTENKEYIYPMICETCEYFLMDNTCGLKNQYVRSNSICNEWTLADYNDGNPYNQMGEKIE